MEVSSIMIFLTGVFGRTLIWRTRSLEETSSMLTGVVGRGATSSTECLQIKDIRGVMVVCSVGDGSEGRLG